MDTKIQELVLVLVLIAAVLVGQYWTHEALTFLAHVAFVLFLEMAVACLVRRGKKSRGPGKS